MNRLMGQEALRCVRQAVTRGVPMGNETRKARVARRLGLDVTLRPRGRPRKDTQKSSWQPLIAEDSGLLKVFGQVGVGLFAAPTVIEKKVQCQYSVGVVGRLESVREQFCAISVEKKVKHPAVLAIAHEARQKLFG
ncbi:MAG: type 2 periplasmic-binding domain-containing protein [Planctomycetota bacterium]